MFIFQPSDTAVLGLALVADVASATVPGFDGAAPRVAFGAYGGLDRGHYLDSSNFHGIARFSDGSVIFCQWVNQLS